MIKFIPNLSEIAASLRSITSTQNKIKSAKLKWSEEHDIAFNNFINAITKFIKHKHFDTKKNKG